MSKTQNFCICSRPQTDVKLRTLARSQICCGCYTAYNRGCFDLLLHLTTTLTTSDLQPNQENFFKISKVMFDYVARFHTRCNDSKVYRKMCKICRFNKTFFTLYHLVFTQDTKQRLMNGLPEFLQKYWNLVTAYVNDENIKFREQLKVSSERFNQKCDEGMFDLPCSKVKNSDWKVSKTLTDTTVSIPKRVYQTGA